MRYILHCDESTDGTTAFGTGENMQFIEMEAQDINAAKKQAYDFLCSEVEKEKKPCRALLIEVSKMIELPIIVPWEER